MGRLRVRATCVRARKRAMKRVHSRRTQPNCAGCVRAVRAIGRSLTIFNCRRGTGGN